MDFFASQEQARRRSAVMVCYFIAAVVLIIGVLYIVGVVFWTLGIRSSVDFSWWHPALFLVVTGAVVLVVLGGSFFESLRLRRSGGAGVAELLGGRPIPPNTDDPSERKLLNVVEEMALAAGIPPPPVYVLDHEKGINAFAAGCQPSDAVIGITRGAMLILDREEWQGVVGHEISHIINGDMRLNLKLMGTLQGILSIALMGRILMHSLRYSFHGRRRKQGGGLVAIIFLGAALTCVGYIGVFFGKLIKSAISRQREFLADAHAVQFTRHPAGLAGALKKIGGLGYGSRLTHPRAEQAGHLFFETIGSGKFFRGLATHPPLSERIRKLDPSFDGTFPRVFLSGEHEKEVRERSAAHRAAAAAFADTQPRPALESARAPMALFESIGAPLRSHLEHAAVLLGALPASLREAAHEPFGSRAVVYGLLLDKTPAVRRRQMERLEQHADPAVLAEVSKLLPFLESMAPQARLPVLDLSVPALKTLSREQYHVFMDNVRILAAADEHISLFEYAVLHTLRHHLDAHFSGPRTRMAQIYGLRGLQTEISLLLSLLARIGNRATPREEQDAFAAGVTCLEEPRADFRFLPAEQCSLECVDEALERMGAAAPRLKKALLLACLACLTHGGKVTIEESELFRAVACALEVPVPPWLATPRQ